MAIVVHISSPLKLRRAEDETRDHGGVHLLHRIIQARLQNLRIGQLHFERFTSLLRQLPAKQRLNGPVKGRVRVGGRPIAE